MQTDMHYYGTYALARMAGFDVTAAETIAYSAQFVDDSTKHDSKYHPDGGLIYGIATAHTAGQVIKNRLVAQIEQRRVWTPFHFLPGGEGDNSEQKLVCVKDSNIAKQMLENHINYASKSAYGLHLMGIACHVYADTFSHYGFSGISSRYNKVHAPIPLDVKDDTMRAYLENKHSKFIAKYAPNWLLKVKRRVFSRIGEDFSGALGHGAVGTYPDRPYLKWQVTHEETGKTEVRNNLETYIEGCEKLFNLLVNFAQAYNPKSQPLISFSRVKDKILEILSAELPMNSSHEKGIGRIGLWKDAITSGDLFPSEQNEALDYDSENWEQQKRDFHRLPSSELGKNLDVYKFYQAATYHRYYVLKELLPKNGIVVF